MELPHQGVDLLEKAHVLEILVTAVFVRNPLPVVSGIVAIQHRSHRIDSEAIEVELLDPVQRVGYEEFAYLGTTGIEDKSSPVRVLSESGVGMFVER